MSDILNIIEFLENEFYQLTGGKLCQTTQFGRIIEFNNFIKTGKWGQVKRFYLSEDDDGSDLFDELYSKYLSALSQNEKLIKELQKHGINTDAFTHHQDESTDDHHLMRMKRIFIAISELSRYILDDSTREQLFREYNEKFFADSAIARYLVDAERFMFNAEDDPSFPIESVLHVKTSEVVSNPEEPGNPFEYRSILLEPLQVIAERLQYLLDLLNR